MHDPEVEKSALIPSQTSNNPEHLDGPLPSVGYDFMGAFENITTQLAEPSQPAEAMPDGQWRKAEDNAARHHNISGEGYSELGERVRCKITRHQEGLDIVIRPSSIFDDRCQMFFVRSMRIEGEDEDREFVFHTPVVTSEVTEASPPTFMFDTPEDKVRALYIAITTA